MANTKQQKENTSKKKEEKQEQEQQQDENVTVSVDFLRRIEQNNEQLAKRVEQLEGEKVQEAAKTINERRQAGEILKTVNISVIYTDDKTKKYVQSWETTKDFVSIENGREIADQRLKVYFDDGTSAEMQHKEFYQNRQLEIAEVVEENSQKMGDGTTKYTWKVQCEDGKELEINPKCVN